MYSFGTSMPKLTGKVISYCYASLSYLNVVGHYSFSHVFENDAVVKPLCLLANLFGGCFCLGSGPFRLSGLWFLLTKRKSGWGICGSSGWVVWFCGCCDLPAFPDRFVLVQSDVLPLMLM